MNPICPGLPEIAGNNLQVLMYRPDPWPAEAVPLVVHHHGQTQDVSGYDYIGEMLASRGYVFLSVTAGTAADQVEEAIACTSALQTLAA